MFEPDFNCPLYVGERAYSSPPAYSPKQSLADFVQFGQGGAGFIKDRFDFEPECFSGARYAGNRFIG